MLVREGVAAPVRRFVGLGRVTVGDLDEAAAVWPDGVDVAAEGVIAVAENDLRTVG